MPALHARPGEAHRPADHPPDPALVDGVTRRLVAGADERVRRRAEAHALRAGRFRQLAALGEGRRQRLLRIDVLAGGDRLAAGLGVRQRHGQVDDDRDLGVREHPLDGHRLDPILLRALRRGLGHQIGDRLDRDQPRARRALEIGIADVAAADDAELDLLHGRHPQAVSRSRILAAGPGERHRVLGLVVLQHHPFRTMRQRLVPERRPVQGAGADVAPAVLVLVLAQGCNVLDVDGGEPVPVPVEPGQRVDAATHQPGEVGLEAQRRPSRPLEQQLERGAAVVEGQQLPVMVVVAEGKALRLQPLRHRAQLGADRAPALRLHLALLERHRRHEELLDADGACLVGHPVEAGAQVGHGHVPRGRGEPARVEHGPQPGRIGELAAHRLHLAEADLGNRVELAIELAILAHGVELDREVIGHVHAGRPIARGARRRRRRTARFGWGQLPGRRARRAPSSGRRAGAARPSDRRRGTRPGCPHPWARPGRR